MNSDYVPTPSASLFAGRSGMYGPPALSDRYVVCLLKRGYKWPENSGNSPESAPANGRKRSSDPYVVLSEAYAFKTRILQARHHITGEATECNTRTSSKQKK